MSFPNQAYVGYYLSFAVAVDAAGVKRLVVGTNLAIACQRAADYMAKGGRK